MSSDVFAKSKQLLRSRQLPQQQMKTELDERNQYLHDKSGGIVADILLAILLFVTLTASMFDMAAFTRHFRAGRRHPSESCGVLVLQPSGR